MQIHEITLRRRVDEGLGSFVKGLVDPQVQQDVEQRKLDKQAAKAAGKLTAQGYGATSQPTSDKWEDKYAALQKDTAVASYAKNLAAGWAKTAGTLVKPTQGLTSATTLQKTIPALVSAAKKSNNNLTSTQIGQILAKSAPTIWANTPDKSAAIAQLKTELDKRGVTVDGASTTAASTKPATKYSYGKPGQMSSTVAASKTGQNMQKMFGQPKGGIQGMQSDLNEASLPDAIKGNIQQWKDTFKGSTPAPKPTTTTAPTTTPPATATVGPAADQYRTAFVKWSDGQLATRVPETGATITMDAVRDKIPDLSTKLSAALNQVIQTQGTAQQTQAVEEYIKLAVAGVQALAQSSKNGVSALSQQQNVQFATSSGAVKQSLRDVGIDPNRLAQFGAQAKEAGSPMATRRTGDTTADTLLKLAGFDLR